MSSAVSPAASAAAAAPSSHKPDPKTFLGRRFEELDPKKPDSLHTTGTLLKVAAVVTVVAFVAISAAAFVATAMLTTSGYAALVGIVAVLLTTPVVNLYHYIDDKSQRAHSYADHLKEIRKEYDSPGLLKQASSLWGSFVGGEATAENKKVLNAHKNYWEKEVRKQEDEIQACEKRKDIGGLNDTQKQKLRQKSRAAYAALVEATTRFAYLKAIFDRPDFETLKISATSDVFTTHFPTTADFDSWGDKVAEEMPKFEVVHFKPDQMKPITMEMIQENSGGVVAQIKAALAKAAPVA